MTDYIISATTPEEPTDDRPAGSLGAELRVLKQYLADTLETDTSAKNAINNAIAAINTKLTSNSGVTGLPANTGLNAVILAMYKELYGYVNSSGVTVQGLVAKHTATANLVAGHTTTLSTHTASINSHTSTISTQGTAIASNAKAITDTNTALTAGLAKDRIQIGQIAMLAVATAPATFFGYGTWVQVCKGRVPLGAGSAADGYGKTAAVESLQGSTSINIGSTNLPPHDHLSGALVRTQGLSHVDGKRINGYSSNYLQDSSGISATWEHHKDHGVFTPGGAWDQRVPHTTEAYGNGVDTNGKALGAVPLTVLPASQIYYFWKRTA